MLPLAWARLLVGTPTVSQRHSTAPLAQKIGETLRQADCTVELHEYAEPSDRNHELTKATLIAWKGKDNRRDGLLFSGHLDTVDPTNQPWTYEPYQLTEGQQLTEQNGSLRPTACWYGLGTTDMKGFIAVALHVLESVDPSSLCRPVGVVLTSDEEVGCRGAKHLADRVRRGETGLGRYMVIGEPTELVPVRKHKGHVPLCITVRGRAAHASDPDRGDNAILNAHEVINAVREFAEHLRHVRDADIDPPHVTVSIGPIRGGTVLNTVPDFCEFHLSIRTVQAATSGWVRRQLERHLQNRVPHLSWAIRFLRKPTEPLRTPAESLLVRTLEDITGRAATGKKFNTEAAIFQQLGSECVVLGPGDIERAHRANEYILTEEIDQAVGICTDLVRRFCVRGSEQRKEDLPCQLV